jgi:hypothetical protein
LSPSPEHVEYAETLLRLAESDLQACRVLAGRDDVADGAVGFHAQQAVEKALKMEERERKPAPSVGTTLDLGPHRDRGSPETRIAKPI